MPAAQTQTEKPTDETIKETFESIVIAFILAFVFRAYVVEAFVIPTGSMAPTLLGEHHDLRCAQCGYRFSVDGGRGIEPRCPMCRSADVDGSRRASAGDRILVHKFLYSIAEPQRWDVVVFKNPQEPSINFIKRLVGLPGERLWIIDGNVYTSRQDGVWTIARKGDRPKVQRAVWQPIYHSDYVPLDRGRREAGRKPADEWRPPWVADTSGGEGWVLAKDRYDNLPRLAPARAYRYDRAEPSAIRFDFDTFVRPGRAGLYPYNQGDRDEHRNDGENVEDVRLAASFQPDSTGLGIAFETTARIDALPAPDATNLEPERKTLRAVVQPDGKARLEIAANDGSESKTLAEGIFEPFAPGVATRVEFWFVDQELSLWVDGKPIKYRFELPPRVTGLKSNIDLVADRPPPRARFPRVRLEVSGSPVTLHEVELDRDLYYSSHNQGPFVQRGGTGTLHRRGDGYLGSPVEIKLNEFYCLGDNSPKSSDSRYWNSVNPWIERNMFDDPLEASDDPTRNWGMVPRKLMMGRAFFVYFPAPLRVTRDSYGVIPNFGDMRFIH